MTDNEKLVELLRDVQYLGGLEEKVADHLIAHGVTVQEWISVKDRPPEKGGEYLCNVKSSLCWTCWEYLCLKCGVDAFKTRSLILYVARSKGEEYQLPKGE